MYQCVCTSLEGFIQQLAVSYIENGYYFYVVGQVPREKDPARLDLKLIDRYAIDVSKWTRARRKRAGGASVQYVRLERIFVLLATHGEHEFFVQEGDRVRDVRRVPLKVFGYALTHKRGHVQVRIEREQFKELRAYFLGVAVHRQADWLESQLRSLPFEPYSHVRRQLQQVLRHVNRARRLRGFSPVPETAIRIHRRLVRPFGRASGSSDEANLVGGRRGEFERGGGASSSPSHQLGSTEGAPSVSTGMPEDGPEIPAGTRHGGPQTSLTS